MPIIKYLTTLAACLLWFPPASPCQTKRADSLKVFVRTANTPEKKLAALFALCEERSSLNIDTLLFYAQMAQTLAAKSNDYLSIFKSSFFIAAGVSKKSLFDSTIVICDDNLANLRKTGDEKALIAEFENLKAQTLIRSAKFKEALSLLYEILHKAESQKDTTMQIKAKSNIGWLHMDMGQYKEGIVWFHNALKTTNNVSVIKSYPPAYTTMASCYNNISSYDSALHFVNKGIEFARHNQQLSYLANGLNIRADVYLNTNKNAAAEADLKEALHIRKLVGDPFYIVSDMTQFAYFYAVTGDYAQGIGIAKQGLEMASQYHLNAKLPLLYLALCENYKRSGNYKSYSEVQAVILNLKDSLYEKNSAEALAGLQAKYDVQKKENIIIQQKLDIISKDYWLYGIIILFAFVTIIGFILYWNYRKKEKIKLEKLLEEQRLNETIAIIKAEEKERKRIAADLHDNLGAYAAAISSNVRNVREAGQFTLALTSRLEENAQDIVNELNNTIWVLKKETQQLTEISDRLKVWLQKLIHNYPAIQYDFDEQVQTDVTFSPANALQLYHILQECINNALRHSLCTHIGINFIGNENWKVLVADDGVGFNPEQVLRGNGLNNLQERAAACGWNISWESNNGKGTVVTVSN